MSKTYNNKQTNNNNNNNKQQQQQQTTEWRNLELRRGGRATLQR
jgi:cell division protein FtsL